MATPTLDIRDLIEMAGGARAVAKASKATDCSVGFDAVYKWQHNGIPDDHWPLMMKLTDIPLDVIYAANQRVKRKKRRARRNSENDSEHRAA
jgi:hypothetical protein